MNALYHQRAASSTAPPWCAQFRTRAVLDHCSGTKTIEERQRSPPPPALGAARRLPALPRTCANKQKVVTSRRWLLANKRECQTGNDEGHENDRQDALSGAPEASDSAVGGVEGLDSAGVSTVADLQGVTSRFDWHPERVVHSERRDTLPVEHDVVGATAHLEGRFGDRNLTPATTPRLRGHLRRP
jgi:hypothetical protein